MRRPSLSTIHHYLPSPTYRPLLRCARARTGSCTSASCWGRLRAAGCADPCHPLSFVTARARFQDIYGAGRLPSRDVSQVVVHSLSEHPLQHKRGIVIGTEFAFLPHHAGQRKTAPTREVLEDAEAMLDHNREAVTTLEDTERIARRVLGGTHPTTAGIVSGLRPTFEPRSAPAKSVRGSVYRRHAIDAKPKTHTSPDLHIRRFPSTSTAPRLTAPIFVERCSTMRASFELAPAGHPDKPVVAPPSCFRSKTVAGSTSRIGLGMYMSQPICVTKTRSRRFRPPARTGETRQKIPRSTTRSPATFDAKSMEQSSTGRHVRSSNGT